MIASLGMYDLPWLTAVTDALWAALRDRLRAAGMDGVPDALDRSRPVADIWRDADLLLAQSCGYPLVTSLRDAVRLVGTPCYDLPGCDGPDYCSFIVVACDNAAQSIAGLREARAAINGWDSQSGMSALRAVVAPLAEGRPFFREVVVTGAHLHSLDAVRDGSADVAALDCVTWGLTAAGQPGRLDGLRVLGRTPATRGLPLVTAVGRSDRTVAMLRDGWAAVMADPALAGVRTALCLAGISPASLADYAPISAMREMAEALVYPELR